MMVCLLCEVYWSLVGHFVFFASWRVLLAAKLGVLTILTRLMPPTQHSQNRSNPMMLLLSL